MRLHIGNGDSSIDTSAQSRPGQTRHGAAAKARHDGVNGGDRRGFTSVQAGAEAGGGSGLDGEDARAGTGGAGVRAVVLDGRLCQRAHAHRHYEQVQRGAGRELRV